MNSPRYGAIGHAAAILAAIAAGWTAHGAVEPPAKEALDAAHALDTVPPRAAQIMTASDAAPLIAVASDGNVTLRVEQQPLEWVLEQIAAQSGWDDVKTRARPARTAASATARPEPVICSEPVAAPDATGLLQAIERGGETERLDGLLRARSDGVPVPEHTLKKLYETDASDRVRLAAFEGYLALRVDVRELRQALESAQYLPNAAIQREAKQRLEDLHEVESAHALAVQGDP